MKKCPTCGHCSPKKRPAPEFDEAEIETGEEPDEESEVMDEALADLEDHLEEKAASRLPKAKKKPFGKDDDEDEDA